MNAEQLYNEIKNGLKPEFEATWKNGRKKVKRKITVLSNMNDLVFFSTELNTVEMSWIEDCDVREDLRDGLVFSPNRFYERFCSPSCADVVGYISKDGIILLNADGEANQWNEEDFNFGKRKIALVSFLCVQNLFELSNQQLEEELKEATLVARTRPDVKTVRSNVSQKEVKELLDRGYSIYIEGKLRNKHTFDFENKENFALLMKAAKEGNAFHQAESVVLKTKSDQYGLFGFDDGQYFGCLLPPSAKPKTMKQAYDCLRPKEIKGKYIRQGEWFVEQLDGLNGESSGIEIKAIPWRAFLGQNAAGVAGVLPRDNTSSKKHSFEANRMIIFEDVFYFQDLSLSHEQHAKIDIPGWSRVLKNTAVRSVSVDGVD